MFRDDRAGGVEDAEFFRVDFHDVTVIRGVDVGDDSGAIQGIGKGAHATAAADAAIWETSKFSKVCAPRM